MKPRQEPDDRELIRRVALGDRSAFTELMQRHIAQIVDFSCRYVGRVADAEDIAQEAFIRVWRKASSWQDQQLPVRHWLYRITYNLCMDALRQRKTGDLPDENILVSAVDTTSSQYDEMAQRIRLRAALNNVPERQRTAIFLCAYYGFSNREAAVILDVSVDALESLLARGRRSLRQQLIEFEKVSE